MKIKSILFLGLAIAALSCKNRVPKQESVWVPIYKNKSEVTNITNLPAQSVVKAGKIYAYQNFLYQLESGKGIHIYHLVNGKPQPLSFIQVVGAEEISIKNDVLYTNNVNDVVALDISNPERVSVESRISNAFNLNYFSVPPTRGYFQCVDTTKGIVVDWELQHNLEARCLY